MGRDSWRMRQHDIERENQRRVNPIWRGVGCLLMSVLAIGGFLFSRWFLVNNRWIYLPPEILAPSITLVSPGLRPVFAPLFQPGVIVSLAVGFIFLIFAYAFLSIAYSFVFPEKRGEFDVPPLRRERRRKP